MRKARQRSKSGYYHTVIRGVNKQYIFLDDKDKYYFKKLMKKFGRKYRIRYHTYVLMDNHVHLLFDDLKENLSKFMQVLCSVYAKYFNRKYDRIGHLFQDRFASETIENNGYLVVCCRYILQNPQKAGICKASEYKWSSYHCYRTGQKMICTSVILGNFNSIKDFYSFINQNNDDECLEIELRPSEKQKYLIEKIKKIIASDSPIINPELPLSELSETVRKIKDQGISISAISRITGLGRYIVSKCI